MARFCSNCGKEVNENADVCLNCGKNLNNEKPIKKNSKIGSLGITLIVIISIIVIAFWCLLFAMIVDESENEFNEDFSNEFIDEITDESVGTINDTLDYKDLEFSLNSAIVYDYIEVNNDKIIPKEGYEYLVFNFEVKNNSDNSYNLNINDFIGYEDSRQNKMLNIDYVNGDKLLNGMIEANMSIKGNVVFEVKKDWHNFDLTYKESNSKEKITFKIKEPSQESNDTKSGVAADF